jgi:hypothetical protein
MKQLFTHTTVAFFCISILVAVGGCFSRTCHDETTAKSVDLNKLCLESPNCKVNGVAHGCKPRTQDECSKICDVSKTKSSCMSSCVGVYSSDCPVFYAPINADTSWEYPLAELGNSRNGLSVLNFRIDAGAPLNDLKVEVSVEGKIICTETANDSSSTVFVVRCALPGKPESVTVRTSGTNPALSPYPTLEEPIPTQTEEVCLQ